MDTHWRPRSDLPLYGPADVERYAGVPNDIIRDWRRRKLIGVVGEQHNTRWKYSGEDLVAFAVIARLSKRQLLMIHDIWVISGVMSQILIERLQEPDRASQDGNFLWAWPQAETRSAPDEVDAFMAIDDDPVAASKHNPEEISVCIDLRRLGEALSADLRQLILDDFPEAKVE